MTTMTTAGTTAPFQPATDGGLPFVALTIDEIVLAPGPALDVDAIAARAEAAPGGTWTVFTDKVQIPWSGPDDEPPCGPWDWGRYLTTMQGEWHGRPDDLPPGLWEFLGSARADVLALAAEVRRLRRNW